MQGLAQQLTQLQNQVVALTEGRRQSAVANESQAAKLLETESRLASAEAEPIQQRRQTTAAAIRSFKEVRRTETDPPQQCSKTTDL